MGWHELQHAPANNGFLANTSVGAEIGFYRISINAKSVTTYIFIDLNLCLATTTHNFKG